MALQDILSAITKIADERITSARSAHQREISEMREENERLISCKKQEVSTHKEEKKQQMLNKAKTHAQMIIRNAELKKKQELLDALYADVAASLAKLPADKVEALLKTCLETISSKGVIHPASAHKSVLEKIASDKFTVGETISASGGFTFVSEKEDRDFTFEHLVASYLRPDTEVSIAHSLFA